MLSPTFRLLIQLHLRIAGRYVRRYHKEVALLVLVVVWMDTLSANQSGRHYLSSLFSLNAAAIGYLSLVRKDRPFLRDVLPNPGVFLLLENLVLCLPVAILLMISGEWLFGLASLVSAALASQVKRARKPRKSKAMRVPVPAEAFEWVAGIRKNALSIVAIYAFGLLLPHSAGFPLMALFFLAFSLANYYRDCESTLLIDALASAPARFLHTKIFMAWKLYLLLALPLIVMSVYRIHSRWYAIPITLVLALLYIAGLVLMKYANYEEGSEAHARASMGNVILIGSLFFPPLMILYEYTLWRKIQGRLHIFRTARA